MIWRNRYYDYCRRCSGIHSLNVIVDFSFAPMAWKSTRRNTKRHFHRILIISDSTLRRAAQPVEPLPLGPIGLKQGEVAIEIVSPVPGPAQGPFATYGQG